MKACPNAKKIFQSVESVTRFQTAICIIMILSLIPTACSDDDEKIQPDYKYYVEIYSLGESVAGGTDVLSDLSDWVSNRVLEDNENLQARFGIFEPVGEGDSKEERVRDTDAKAIEKFDALDAEINTVLSDLERDFITLRKQKSEQIKNMKIGRIELNVSCRLIKAENKESPFVAGSLKRSSKIIMLSATAGETYE